MFKDVSHYFILQMLNKNSKKINAETYKMLTEKSKSNMKIGDIPVAYFKQTVISKPGEFLPEIELRLEFTSLQNAIEEVKSLKYVEFRNEIPVFEV